MSASLVSFPANPEQQRLCQGRYSHELALRIPLDGLSSPSSTLAAGLARYADGRPLLSIHVKSSGLNLSADPKISTRGFRNAGKSVQKTGK